MRFIDTNILLRHIVYDDPAKGQRATALLERVERGEELATTSALVVFEVVFTLDRVYREPKTRIAELVLPIFLLPGIKLANKRLWQEAFRLWTSYSINFADAYNAAFMHAREVAEIYSWDKDFDSLPDITRVEP